MSLLQDVSIRVGDRWLEADFAEIHFVLSWAVVGGGRTPAKKVLWHRVDPDALTPEADAREYFRSKLLEEGKDLESVGFLTAARLSDFTESVKSFGGVWARCVCTAGLSNAVRIGDPPSPQFVPGTINILLQLSEPLSEAASLEALSLTAEARTLAVLEENIPSSRSLLWATGTGTDCIAVATPQNGEAGSLPLDYAGKHTPAGHVIGAAVYEAVSRGVRKWKKQWRKNFS